jgi:shikimate dehydrogenase
MAKEIYGIVGHPVGHSLSPAMHNAAFRELGMDAEYRPFDVKPEDLEDFLRGLPGGPIRGVNVTIPHKIAAKEYIEREGSLDKEAAKLGAVNTVKVEGGALKGYNTDGAGFYRSLVLDLKFEPEGKRVFIMGAGGAARAITMYLGDSPGTVSVFDIDAAKAEALKERYESYFKKGRIRLVSERDLAKALSECQLFVNATPVGMKESDPSPVDAKSLPRGAAVYDLVYNRPKTALVREATLNKLHAVTGIGMLLYQGAIAFEIWTGRKPPIDVMRKALKSAMGGVAG